MKRFRAVVRNGRLVLDVPCSLPEGTSVELGVQRLLGGSGVARRKELDAALFLSAADAAAGRWVGEKEMTQRLQGG